MTDQDPATQSDDTEVIVDTPDRGESVYVDRERDESVRIGALREAMATVAASNSSTQFYFNLVEELTAKELKSVPATQSVRAPEGASVVYVDTPNRELKALRTSIKEVSRAYPGSEGYFRFVDEVDDLIISGKGV